MKDTVCPSLITQILQDIDIFMSTFQLHAIYVLSQSLLHVFFVVVMVELLAPSC
jgi:hypothetical protein